MIQLIKWIREHYVGILVSIIVLFTVIAILGTRGCDNLKVRETDEESVRKLEMDNNQLRGENNILRTQRDEAIKQGKALEADRQVLQLERDGLQTELEKYGLEAKKGIMLQKEAAARYEEELADINIDKPVMDRCLDYCGMRAAEGFRCKPDPEKYCTKLYGTR